MSTRIQLSLVDMERHNRLRRPNRGSPSRAAAEFLWGDRPLGAGVQFSHPPR
jgi:hypothetical protein